MGLEKDNKEQVTLDDVVNEESSVYFLSEVGYDAHYFNPQAYNTLLKYIAKDESVTGIVIDGALTRLDRPEFLNDALTYWVKTQEECEDATKKIPYHMQYTHMRDKQMSTLDKRLKELKSKIPNAEIMLSIESDDLQFTASSMLNELLLKRQEEFNADLGRLGRKVKNADLEYRKQQKRYDSSEKGFERAKLGYDKNKGKTGIKAEVARKKYLQEQSKFKQQMKRRVTDLSKCESVINSIKEEITSRKEDKELFYRVKKSRPMHQWVTANFVEDIHATYQSICGQNGVKLVKTQGLHKMGNLVFDYGHNRHFTQAVIKGRDKALLNSTHGKMPQYQKRALEQILNAKNGVDVIVESGHAGIGYKQLQKTHDGVSETNFRNQSAYDQKIPNSYITITMVLPFEDQSKIDKFRKGEEPVRMSVGKPTGTRRTAAVDRLRNGGVSGLTVIKKNKEGIIGTEWIQYQNFIDGTVLKEPSEYASIYASSDEHIGSPEANWTVQDGLLELYKKNLRNPLKLRGKPVFAKGYISGGDTAEANSKSWNHRYHFQRNPRDVLEENIELLSSFNPTNADDVRKLVLKMTNDAHGGSVENMAVILDWVADFYDSYLNETLAYSDLKHAHISVTGNHADGVLRDLGIREWDFFKQRLKAKGMPVYTVGEPDYLQGSKVPRVYLGGQSNARIINIEDYGVNSKGKAMFGPINLVIQHDPKGGGFAGMIGEGRNAEADLALAGHTHENWVKLDSTGNNTFRVAYRMATLQGVSATEKYYAGSVPRTSAGHRFVMPQPGHFYEEALPASYLRKKGQEVLDKKITEAFKL